MLSSTTSAASAKAFCAVRTDLAALLGRFLAVPLCDHAILMRALDNEFLFGGLAHNHFGSRQNPAKGIGKSPGGVLMLGRGKH